MTTLTQQSRQVLAMIPFGMDRPRPRIEIEQATGLNKRAIETTIERLKYKGWPIVAIKKDKFHGYYLPRNEEERQAGLEAYKQQIATSQAIVRQVEKIDLESLPERLQEVLT